MQLDQQAAQFRLFKLQNKFLCVDKPNKCICQKGFVRKLNTGPLAPEARIIPLDQQAVGYLLMKLHNLILYVDC